MKKILAAVAAVLLIACVTGFVFAANTVAVYDQLMEAESLSDFRSILLAEENRSDVSALTLQQITELSGRVEFLYAGILDPTEDDSYTKDELLETLSILPNGPETLYGEPTTYADLPTTVNANGTSSHERHSGYILSSQTYTISGTIQVNTKIVVPYGVTATIQGEGTFTRPTNAGYKRDFFFVEPGGTLIIKGTGAGIVIDGTNNQLANSNLIWCQGGLQLENVHLKNSKTSNGDGNSYAAAITINQGDGYMYVDGSKPGNNDAEYPASTNVNRVISFKNTTFTNCLAEYAGGVQISGKGNSVLLENVTFTNCDTTSTTTGYAGALRYVANMPLTMNDCTFSGCDALTYGGGVVIDTTYTVAINDTTISSCTAKTGSAIMLYGNRSPSVTLTRVTVQDCQNAETTSSNITYGSIASNSANSNYKLALNNCTFRNNAASHGAGIYWACGSNATLSVTDCNFKGNSATYYSTTVDNKTSYHEGHGGAIYINTTRGATITGTTFEGNTARSGGACMINGPSTFEGCTFTNNSCLNEGGAVRFNGNTTIKDCEVTYSGGSNSAAAGGAFCIYPTNGLVYDIQNTKISGTAAADGSAIMLSGGAIPTTVNLYRVLIENCNATGTGGSIRATGKQRYVLNLDQCVIRNNSHTRGGAIYWNCNGEGAAMTIKDSQFLGNNATVNGGALFLEATCTVQGTAGTMTEPILSGNIPAKGIVGTRFEDNTATDKGGAICIATYNDASAKNNPVYFEGDSSSVTLTGNVTLADNSADIGGGISYDVYNSTCFRDNYTFNLICDGTVISGNKSNTYGGAIFLEYNPRGGTAANVRDYSTDLGYKAALTVKNNAQIDGNRSPFGGAIYVGKGQCTIESATINGNTSTGDGGAIYITATPIPVGTGEIVNSQKNTIFTMSDGTFSNNQAVNGGAVAIYDGDVSITGGTMDGNTASNNGGAVYVNGGNYTMDSGTLSNNTASNMGGGLAVNNGNVVIGRESCKGDDNGHAHPVLLNNVATKDGGGIAVTGGTTTMYCGALDGNSCTENQAGSSYYQEQTTVDSIFTIYGGDLDIGVNVESGTFNDQRENEGYTVTYHAIYDAVNISTEQRVAGNFVTLPGATELNNSAFVRSGKVLLGWSTVQGSETGFLPVGSNLTLTSNADLFAVWKNETYTISYVLGNGTVSGNPTSYAVTTGSKIINLNQPSPTIGEAFMGWMLTSTDGNWTQSDINGANLMAGGKYGNITLTAQWKSVAHSISYDFGCTDYVDPGNPNGFSSGELPITLRNPSRPGYTFTGWHLNSTSGTTVTQLTAYQNYKLYATWSLNTYVATFDANGGTLTGSSSVSYSITGSITLPAATRPGYKFIGWRAIAVEGNWQMGESYTGGSGKYGKVTLRAQWERSLVDLTLNISGADAGQSVLITITGTPTNGERFSTLRFAMVANMQGKGTVTIDNLPVGNYTVVVEKDWSWRYNSESAQLDGNNQVQVSTDSTVSFVFTKVTDQWLNDCYSAGFPQP